MKRLGMRMSQTMEKTAVFVALALMLSPMRAQAQKAVEWSEENSYPESLMTEANREEINVKSRNAERERELARTRAMYEQRKAEVEREVTEKRARINDLKVKQEELDQEIQGYRTELAELDSQREAAKKDLERVNATAKIHTDQADGVKADLDKTKDDLNNTLMNLAHQREDTFRRIDKAQTQISQWQDEISKTNSDIIAADNTRMEYEKAAAKIRNQVEEMQLKVQDAQNAKAEALEETRLMKENMNKADAEYKKTVQNLRDAESDRNKAQVQLQKTRAVYNVEMKKLDEKTAQAHMLKALADNEKNRSETETQRLNDSLLKVKQLHEEVSLEVVEAQSALMQSKISLGQIRTDLTRELATKDSRGGKGQLQARTLASTDDATALPPKMEKAAKLEKSSGGDAEGSGFTAHKWTVKRSCWIYQDASKSSEKIGSVKVKEALRADHHADGFVKVSVSNGGYGYVRASCGDF